MRSNIRRAFWFLLIAITVGSLLLTACQIQINLGAPQVTPVPTRSVAFRPGTVLGIQGDATTGGAFSGIPWVRLSYPTCVASDLSGQVLKDTIKSYHAQGCKLPSDYASTLER